MVTRFGIRKQTRVLYTGAILILGAGLLLGAALREPGNIDAVTAADISPNSGSTAGGAIVKITGNFSPSPTTMQQMTRAYCASMAVYNGTNPGAVLSLSDTRNSQTYHVAKLADNNCWMLDDLKIADFKATAADTNLVSGGVSSNGFTIPGLDTTNTDDYNSPRVYGPVPGTGSGAANYGYLYNWNAATAGETTTSMPGDGTNKDVAPNSICPKSWRLPKGGSNDDVNNEFSQLNAKMAGLSSNQDSAYQNKYTSYYNNWQNGGLFKGVLSGYWVGSFLSQNTDAILWSSSAYPKVDYNAFYMYFNKSGAFPGSYGDRNKGVAIRCLATGGASTTPTITFDGVPATNVSISSDSKTITATAPKHTSGYVDVVINNGVDPPITVSNGYHYYDSMTISKATPNYGTENGGDTITITGANITPPTITPTTMQQMTGAYCIKMPVHPAAGSTITLTDSRDNQLYQVRKMADGNCWMINNLKLGSTTGTMQLTPANTNVTSNFTLPQIGANVSSRYEQPVADALLSGDKGYNASKPNSSEVGINNPNFAGYYYNWCAATGGDPKTCTPQNIAPSDATQDICPANWRLPTGNATGELAMLNAKMNDPDATSPSTAQYYANWQFDGPFRGVFSGDRRATNWGNQGINGNIWSSSRFPSDSSAAYYTFFTSAILGTGNSYNSRNISFSIRCMAPGIAIHPTLKVTFDTGSNAVQGTVTAWSNTSITVTTPAHSPGLVSITVSNGVDSVVLPATCSSATSTACNGKLDSGETRGGDRANVTRGFLYEETYISLSVDKDNVQIGGSLVPTSAGTFGTGANIITTSTNSPKGYSLSVSTNLDSSKSNAKDLKHTSLNQYIIGTNNTCTWNSTANTLTNTTNKLANNTWGFTLNTANRDAQQFCQVPAKNNPLTIKSTAAPNETGDVTNVFYGTKVDMTKPGGKYQTTVVYSVVGKS